MRISSATTLAVVVALSASVSAGAAVKDTTDADASVNSQGGGKYTLVMQDTGDTPINSFVLVPGAGLVITGYVSASNGSCQAQGANLSCNVSLLPPQCACTPGTSVVVTFTGTGTPAGTTILIGSTTVTPMTSAIPGTTAPTASAATATKTTSVQTKTKTKAKAKTTVPLCKKGQHSTKKKPCRR
jgi:hypothetical protein